MECVCQVDKGSIILADDNIQPFLWNVFFLTFCIGHLSCFFIVSFKTKI